MTKSVVIALASLILVLALVGGIVAKKVATRNSGATAIERLYTASLDDADGHLQRLSQWRGQYLVVNFWATWCAPCVKEMPELDRLQRQFEERNVQIVGLGIENAQQVRQFRERLGIHLTLLAGGYNALSLARELGDDQGVLPYTVMLSTKGEVLHRNTGALQPGQMQAWLTALP